MLSTRVPETSALTTASTDGIAAVAAGTAAATAFGYLAKKGSGRQGMSCRVNDDYVCFSRNCRHS